MALFAQFLLRLAFGLAVGMGITSPQQVSSGFFRNHLYVTLGLTTLAALVATGMSTIVVAFAALAAVCSYVGSVSWLFEAKRLGRSIVWLVAWLSLFAAWVGVFHGRLQTLAESQTDAGTSNVALAGNLELVSVVTSGLVLGMTTAAMLLGHWYLNSPGMRLEPLRRLLAVAAAAVCLQMLVSTAGLVGVVSTGGVTSTSIWMFVVLRWSFGLVGVLVLLWMAWQTLKIPNTQSATGILYVAVIGVFVGELAAGLLSAESAFPL